MKRNSVPVLPDLKTENFKIERNVILFLTEFFKTIS